MFSTLKGNQNLFFRSLQDVSQLLFTGVHLLRKLRQSALSGNMLEADGSRHLLRWLSGMGPMMLTWFKLPILESASRAKKAIKQQVLQTTQYQSFKICVNSCSGMEDVSAHVQLTSHVGSFSKGCVTVFLWSSSIRKLDFLAWYFTKVGMMLSMK